MMKYLKKVEKMICKKLYSSTIETVIQQQEDIFGFANLKF